MVESGLTASLLVHDDVHQAIFANCLTKLDLQDGQDRTTRPRCNALQRQRRRNVPLFKASQIWQHWHRRRLIRSSPTRKCLALVISDKMIQVGTASVIVEG